MPAILEPPVARAHSLASLPTSVSAERWEQLCRLAERAERLPSLEDAALRAVVVAVVRQLRRADEGWSVVYGALSAIVALPCDGTVRAPSEYELHASRGAALVAQMQSWADLERLTELEASDPD